MRSMTGYGRGIATTALGRFTAEFQSINRRHFELQCFLPPSLIRFESLVRSMTSSITRGMLTYRLQVFYSEGSSTHLIPNISIAEEVKKGWQVMAPLLGYDATTAVPIPLIASRTELWITTPREGDEEELRQGIATVTEAALAELIKAKEREGKALQCDITARGKAIALLLDKVNKSLDGSQEHFRDQLRQRLQSLLDSIPVDEERLCREMCLFADKSDTSEESTRLTCHLQQLQEICQASHPSNGKQLEFLLQEINRELSTFAAKSPNLIATHLILTMKGEAEKIREQIQNVE